ncbi:MAG: type II toxin-antitoxin system VapC family toxin [Terracidiphilus sp.]|jgi:toxin-antitoxin system PIN domain toxin
MIVIDVNLLIYAYDSTTPSHVEAKAWIEEVFSSGNAFGLPWQNIAAFIRVLTYPGLHGERFSRDQALFIVEQWLAMPHMRALAPGERHWPLFREMLIKGDVRGKLTTDAQLAALTIEYGGVLHTTDRDFARFPGLRWMNPLAP